MKLKKNGLYVASNVNFDPSEIEARSYGWWVFVKRVNGLVVFNNYRYSPTTARHQSKVYYLMSELSIEIDLVVSTPRSLNDPEAMESAVKVLESRIIDLHGEIFNGKKQVNEFRMTLIDNLRFDQERIAAAMKLAI